MLGGLVMTVLLTGLSPTTDRPDIAPDYGFVGAVREDGMVLARQVIPAEDNEPPIDRDRNSAVAQSRVVFLNRNGVTLTPGTNDARMNRSTVITQTTSIPAWRPNEVVWSNTVSCMRELFAEYDITFIESDPGPNTPHIEAVFGGTPQLVNMDATIAGVSPFTTDCSIIENSIVFTFVNAAPFTSREICEIMAQEIAHSYGLDHILLASDPMTYLPYDYNRSFQNVPAMCGEIPAAPRACGINGNVCRQTQNSVQMLRERLGPAKSGSSGPTAPLVEDPYAEDDIVGGCASTRGGSPAIAALTTALLLRRRRRRPLAPTRALPAA